MKVSSGDKNQVYPQMFLHSVIYTILLGCDIVSSKGLEEHRCSFKVFMFFPLMQRFLQFPQVS